MFESETGFDLKSLYFGLGFIRRQLGDHPPVAVSFAEVGLTPVFSAVISDSLFENISLPEDIGM